MSWPTSLPASRRNHNCLLLTRNTTRTLRLGCAFLYAHVDSAGNVFKAKRCSLLFPLQQPLVCWASKRRCPGEALFLVVKVVQVVFPCVHVDSAGNASEAKRCYMLFPLQQPLVCMGLEEAISWRIVVHCCKGCSSCFPLCPRDFLSRQRENYMRVYGFSFGRMSGESYFCSRKRVITLKRKSGL